MIPKHPFTGNKIRTVLAVAVFSLIILLGSVSANAEGNQASLQNGFEFGGGYFTPQRGTFRDLYGSGVTGQLGYEFPFKSQYRMHPLLMFSYTNGSLLPGKYYDASLSIMLERELFHVGIVHWAAAAGPGMNTRWIRFDGPREVILSYEFGAVGVACLDTRLVVSGATICARLLYDRPLTGDPQTGGFGNTGGFHFVLILGAL